MRLRSDWLHPLHLVKKLFQNMMTLKTNIGDNANPFMTLNVMVSFICYDALVIFSSNTFRPMGACERDNKGP